MEAGPRGQMFERAIRILLVEDNIGDAKLAQLALNESSLRNEITLMENGSEALDFLFKRNQYNKAKTPDMIILDLNLPKKNGREVLKEVKGDPILKKIPVLILTTSNSED